ncbi:unnamed protein product [Pleuronectes platessa]|uniref:Uncharacterized protein n=1 Tax=Pleuronectes platessa TaxID=8262 RepID=A0A9N7Y4W1_PLEPL|nr:unnamed protein product [Pleuronectes platessa]
MTGLPPRLRTGSSAPGLVRPAPRLHRSPAGGRAGGRAGGAPVQPGPQGEQLSLLPPTSRYVRSQSPAAPAGSPLTAEFRVVCRCLSLRCFSGGPCGRSLSAGW